MNILLLGATGFLGSQVLAELLEMDETDMIFALSRRKVNEKNSQVVYFTEEEQSVILKNNKIDWLINCVGVYQREEHYRIIEGNLNCPLVIMDYAIQCGVKNFINMNTSLPENLNLYSFSKRELGRFGRFYSEQYEINFYNLLLEMFYGPEEPKERFISSMLAKMKMGLDMELTEGNQRRDIIRVEDVCQAVRVIMNSSLIGYYDIPVGTGEGHSIRETIEFLHAEQESSSRLLFGAVPLRRNEPDCIADISLLKRLGFIPQYTWESGLKDMISSYEGREKKPE